MDRVKQSGIAAEGLNRAAAATKRAGVGEGSGEHEKTLKTPAIRFFVPGQPVGKGRPRAAARGRHVRLYTPEKTVTYESLVATAAHGAMQGRPPIQGACIAQMVIRQMVPLSWSAKKRTQALSGEIRPAKKPDIDNVVKALFDAMNGVVWVDDVQVVNVSALKVYSETPGVVIEVSEI